MTRISIRMSLLIFLVLSILQGKEATTKEKIIDEIYGDLTKDNIDEKITVLDTGVKGDFGSKRKILIYKKVNKLWKLWHTSQGAILPSEHGGMMGDPYSGINMDRGSLVIEHWGGSADKWRYIHRYRFNGHTFRLIGSTINSGAPCRGFTFFDYNLLTGKAIYEKTDEKCDDEGKPLKETKIVKNLSLQVSSLPKMNGFYPGDNELKLSDINETIYY